MNLIVQKFNLYDKKQNIIKSKLKNGKKYDILYIKFY